MKYPARFINNVRILPNRTMSVPVSVALSSAQVLFRPSFKLQQRSPIFLLNSSLTIHHHTSFISIHNLTIYSCSLSKGIILGTTTIPTLSFKRNSITDYQSLHKNINDLTQHINTLE
ncbi:unnamed protein product [Rotaria sp. Silwood2]|nr:unnamed protein product [Rotaria sp. Silwood2]CAF3013116.1 unnamed protein product [Rotaria sp. Silwood2]CAF3293125.1 unnamed protein product [Rotaria sp. Silwood2]CAF3323892.1 unnamed protein product [Rotaria sp. Silwood2]CAF4307736.1 unnamed protein product [Rotaria sp. Silwood2]